MDNDTVTTLLIDDPNNSSACDNSSTSGCFVVDGVVLLNNKSVVALYSFTSPYLIYVDLKTDQIDTTVGSFDTGLVNSASFSGGSAIVAGAIGDNSSTGIWLAAQDGYYFVDMSTNSYTISRKFSTTDISENFGANVAHDADGGVSVSGYLWAPNYSTVDFMDIKSGTLYTSDSATDTAIGLSKPDHGAVDTKLDVGLIANESGNIVALIDLSQVSLNDTDKTWSVPASGINSFTIPEAGSLSGVAVESANHIALFMYEWGNDTVIIKLDPANKAQISDYVYLEPGTYSGGDPHAVAIGVDINKNTIGYLPSTDGKSIVLNLTNLLDTTKYSRESDGHTLSSTTVDTAKTAGDIREITY